MPIHIYNSLTKKKEEFKPLTPGRANIYTCGVTVYDECHIGHARSLYIFDVLRRYLKYRGFKVNFVRNITDIDDKIINRAKELEIDWAELVKKYIARYYDDLDALGIERADYEPRATENIADMIKHIEALIDKGYAYVTDSGVYFNLREFKEYGKLSGQSASQMHSGVRKEPDETKYDPLDFALWKRSKPDEPFWGSPWGEGRPGWHIECSVMSAKYLKAETLDIHAGGQDLIFPHHENEIAQSEALTGKPFAKYWLHHGLLTINGRKMAKSSGNFVTIEDFLKEEDPHILKLFFLSAHYRSPLDYNDAAVHIARENAETFDIFFNKVKEMKAHESKNNNFKEVEELKNKFIQAMDDDFNTPVALSILLEMISEGNKSLLDKNSDKALSISETIGELLEILNISEIKYVVTDLISDNEILNELVTLQDQYRGDFTSRSISLITIKNQGDAWGNIEKIVKKFIELRHYARDKKDFALSDKIRNDMLSARIILEDTKEGATWRRKL